MILVKEEVCLAERSTASCSRGSIWPGIQIFMNYLVLIELGVNSVRGICGTKGICIVGVHERMK